MILALLLIPTLAAVAAFFLRPHGPRRVLLVATAIAHAGLTAWVWATAGERPLSELGGYLVLGDLERLFLAVTSGLFLACSFYAMGYLRREGGQHSDIEEGFLFDNAPEATFTACLLAFLATMTLVIVAQHLGILWVAVEATTLASAPLIYFHRHHRSLEATWKYLLICSVGIALALLGNFFLAAAASSQGGSTGATLKPAVGLGASQEHPQAGKSPLEGGTFSQSSEAGGHAAHVEMTVQGLMEAAKGLNPIYLKAGFLLLLVGYGTKMGLAPLHTWLPDAHSEAPSVISALLSGALLNCAFLAILRVYAVLAKASPALASFAQELLVALGLVSMGVAAVFIIAQADYKRMLAYSSVEHMGILSFGLGIGGLASAGCLLHVCNHSLTKASLFLLAGNVLGVYRTKSTAEVRGLLRAMPVTGLLWLAGFLAIAGSPPFGPFMSELKILLGAVQSNLPAAATALGLLVAIFVAMARIALSMVYGEASVKLDAPVKESRLSTWPPAAMCLAVLVLGVYVPPGLTDTIRKALTTLGVP